MKHPQLTDELQERASLYAIGALPESERMEYAQHIEKDQCAVCRAAVHDFEGVTTLLAYGVPPATPSAALKTRLMEQARNSAPVTRQAWFFRRRWLEWTTSTAAVAAVIVTLVIIQENRELRHRTDELTGRIAQLEIELSQQREYIATLTSPENRVVNLAGQGANLSARGRIFWDQPQKRWLFFVRGLPRVAGNLTYQLWFVPKTGNPVSAKAFNTEANGSAEIQIDLPDGLTDLKAAAVTTEPAPGVPQPTGAVTLAGAAE